MQERLSKWGKGRAEEVTERVRLVAPHENWAKILEQMTTNSVLEPELQAWLNDKVALGHFQIAPGSVPPKMYWAWNDPSDTEGIAAYDVLDMLTRGLRIRRCQQCGGWYAPAVKYDEGMGQKYCSNGCRQKALTDRLRDASA